ncbi:hypothetical protein OS493_006738 [Desmophyllum pertusum]|uniref:Uncharacterized protein n=1 Tax=Desmophyllum pertusum TaxID=174260 RepID=A0A9X0D504_9CNID|nr:hypothetical protein OS493_006738 [Desmophyllum pertusum]
MESTTTLLEDPSSKFDLYEKIVDNVEITDDSENSSANGDFIDCLESHADQDESLTCEEVPAVTCNQDHPEAETGPETSQTNNKEGDKKLHHYCPVDLPHSY